MFQQQSQVRPSSAAMPPGPGQPAPDTWKPRIRRLHDYWRAIHPPEGLPGRQHFDPMAVTDLLPHIWLLDVQLEPFRLRYRLTGTAMVESHRRELTGLWLDEAHPHLNNLPDYNARYRRVVAERQPSWRRGRPFMDHHHRIVENIVLPLATDGCRVDILLCISELDEPIYDEPPRRPAS